MPARQKDHANRAHQVITATVANPTSIVADEQTCSFRSAQQQHNEHAQQQVIAVSSPNDVRNGMRNRSAGCA